MTAARPYDSQGEVDSTLEDAYWSARAARAEQDMEDSGEHPIPWEEALAVLEAAGDERLP